MPLKAEDQDAKARLSLSRHLYYEKNKERIKAKVRAYQKRSRKKIRIRIRRRRAANLEFFKERNKRYYLKYRENRRARSLAYHYENRDRLLKVMKARYRRNRKYRIERQKKYYFANHEKCKASMRKAYWRDFEKSRSDRRLSRLRNIHKARRRDRIRAKIRHAKPEEKIRRVAYYQRTKAMRVQHSFAKSVIAKAYFANTCGSCGYSDRPDVLEFDHIKKPYKRGRSRDWRDRPSNVLRNPERFRLLCANCHAIRTTLQKMAKAKNLKIQEKHQCGRRRLIDRFGGRCKLCKYDKNWMVFEFDHKRPIFGKGRSSAIHHVRKWPHLFQLLCSNCHNWKTAKDMVKAGRRKNLHPSS